MTDDLRTRTRQALPANVLALMDEIEAFAGMHLSVEPPHRAPKWRLNPDAEAIDIWHGGVTLFLKDTENIDPRGVLHELLHIHRYWIERTPMLVPIGNAKNQRQITSATENTLEHLNIIPREVDYGFDPYPYWNELSRELWSNYPWKTQTAPFARRMMALFGKLDLNNVTSADIIDTAQQCLQQEGLADEADKFDERIKSLINSKPRAVSCVFRFLNIPREEAHMVTLDVLNKRSIPRAIPAH